MQHLFHRLCLQSSRKTFCAKFKMYVAAELVGVLMLLWLSCSMVSCQGPASRMGYDYSNGPNGPANWGNLNYPYWVKCNTGTQQSPIDVTKDRSSQMSLDVVYRSDLVAADIYNNGHTPTVEVLDQGSGMLTLSSMKYELKEIHFHSPSEHRILGHSFSMEQHMVHESAGGQIAVITLLYNLGSTNEFLAQFFGSLPPYTRPDVKAPIKIKLPWLNHDFYYQYNGSLTTPPCNESVIWTILDHYPTLSNAQLQQLQASKPEDNARPLQPKNRRMVDFFYKR